MPWPDTRQSLPLCRVSWPDTRQRAQLCRVSLPLHSAKLGNLVFSCSFCQLCRVQWALHSAKRPLPSVTLGKASIIAYFFLVFTFQHFHHTFKQKISQIFITFFKSMTFITHSSLTYHKHHLEVTNISVWIYHIEIHKFKSCSSSNIQFITTIPWTWTSSNSLPNTPLIGRWLIRILRIRRIIGTRRLRLHKGVYILCVRHVLG